MKSLELRECPFCGGRMKFFREEHMNKHNRMVVEQYWMHEENVFGVCVLETTTTFTIGAGDARFDEEGNMTYVGEYGELWNRRAEDNDEL